ncbi:MAG: ribulose-phosphate 3-epimerase [Candidatus Paceibacterota bacterium]
MANITPSIISQEFTEIKDKIGRLEGLAPWVHLDVMDGKFVPPMTWSAPDDLKAVAGQIKVEVHLMTEKPEEILADWLLVADRAVIHFEATDCLADIIDRFKSSATAIGLAFKLETPVEDIFPYVEQVALIQLMSIAEIGYHGRPFDRRVLDKVKTLRRQFPDVIIQLDGGINLQTAPEAASAGADNLIVGSAVWQSDNLPATLTSLQKI